MIMARRKEKTRELRSESIIIIGEGLTEQYYFQHIRSLYGYHYQIKPHYFGNTSLPEMEAKIEKVLQDKLGTVVCVFDSDVSEREEKAKQHLERLLHKYSKNKKVIICNTLPSIEYWFLLHFCNTNRYFQDSKAVEKELRKFIRFYEKTAAFLSQEKWVADLCADNKLTDALTRAKHFSESIEAGQSYSNIYRAFVSFNNLH